MMLQPASRLLVMVALAQALPVAFIPEQLPVATMRNDVIDYSRRSQLVLFHAFHTQRISGEESLSRCPPPGVISPSIRTPAQPVTAPRHMIFAEYLAHLAEARASGIAAGPIWFLGHILLLSKQQKSSVVIHRFAALILHGSIQCHN